MSTTSGSSAERTTTDNNQHQPTKSRMGARRAPIRTSLSSVGVSSRPSSPPARTPTTLNPSMKEGTTTLQLLPVSSRTRLLGCRIMLQSRSARPQVEDMSIPGTATKAEPPSTPWLAHTRVQSRATRPVDPPSRHYPHFALPLALYHPPWREQRVGRQAAAAAAGRRSFCRHWCQHGACKWGPACRYRHTMPTTAEGLAEVGLRDFPGRWTAAVHLALFVSSKEKGGGDGGLELLDIRPPGRGSWVRVSGWEITK